MAEPAPAALAQPWGPVSPGEDPELQALGGQSIAGFRARVYAGRRNHVGSRYFRLDLEDRRGAWPVILGLRNRGPHPAMNWVEVGWYGSVLPAPVDSDLRADGTEEALFRLLAACIPPGGHLMVEYESPQHEETERGLAAGIPPAATPLGMLLVAAGVGDWIRDWYIPEGWSEGPRKLQGFRALDGEHRRRRAAATAALLREFLARAGDDPLVARARVRARELLRRLDG